MASFTYQGFNIHYTNEGAGRPLVFIHGLGGNSVNWLYQRNYFKSNYQVIAVDMPGHGKSEGREKLNYFDYHKVLHSLLVDELGLEQIVFCGISMGGRVSLDFASRYPEKVAGIIAADTFVGVDDEEKKRRKAVFDLIYEPNGVEKWVTTVIDQMGLDPNGPIAKGFNKGILDNHLDFMYKLFTMILDYDQREDLANITAPALIIHGERDRFIPLHCSEDIHQRLACSELVIMNDCGHLPNVEQPKRFNELVEDFLARS